MIVNPSFIFITPFIDSYFSSDLFGKILFLTLGFLSLLSWTIIAFKWKTLSDQFTYSKKFYSIFEKENKNILQIPLYKESSPFQEIYLSTKKYTVDILNKNLHFNETLEKKPYLSPDDLHFIASLLNIRVQKEFKNLDSYLFILSTVVTLAPFVGLLGTVWGILVTFTHLDSHSGGNASILAGLSLALTTTVLGLVIAIPALIGYNVFKNWIKDFEIDMDGFSQEMLAHLEMQYRKV